MRSSQELPVDTAQKDVQANIAIPSTADLRVTVTGVNQSKRRKRTFRVIERPDGVIVECPSYRKSLPTLTPERHLQKKPVVLPIPSEPSKPMLGANACKNKEELLGIGAFAGGTGRIGQEDFAASRGGYNAQANNTEELKLERYVEDAYNGVAPMERFLAESGLWSPLSRRSV
ncbi:hypothetical protein PtrSN002B_011075 [Pyrenophora tritici-repentis]|uniref:Uncharacterized protein n=2 Tax=Pyrenophora tritici-repentis TaxID=45151 RepID=A0A2W1EKX4_9PLEO|nr:uncharacterized protein PTRG_01804 [Pyrenophora tritici-repentis Pt-1C-BFP]KAA8626507.1 hypothetical protein PtrV1_02187 [Pyrenophora tritici-repentis]EDU41242.1 predicted protein [Pyrenophora tritici-repentis Pt-1C-BFP]KAF7454932.1 hypothetical protein A1F99_021900 [Pyrenophora tritici-repentis]KAF7578078.1 hypothetical protein PtrM4_023180 [Pyrenophora tritici-repentis]KAG9388691.1 hypothetical protein A1F94_001584 [Pyrenophora tritici-repentis]